MISEAASRGSSRKRKKEKAFTGVHALLVFPSGEDHKATLDLMRRFSSAVRYAYNRLLEGQTRENLKRQDGPMCALLDQVSSKAEAVKE